MKKLLALMALGISLFASNIEVKDAYARATPPNLPNSASFMTLINTTDKDIDLVSASSDISNVVELHTHDMKNGVMTMYQVPKIQIKANSQTVLKPGGFHVMLIDLKTKPLKEGENIDITLNFSDGSSQTITAPIKKVMAGMKMGNHGMNKDKSKMSCGNGSCGQGKCGN